MPHRQRIRVFVIDTSPAGALAPSIDDGDLMLQSPIADELNLAYGINVKRISHLRHRRDVRAGGG